MTDPTTSLVVPLRTPLMNLILEVDPHPSNLEPSVNPITQARLLPLHLLQADYHISPPIKPMGWICPEVLLEMIAFEQYRFLPVFTFWPRLTRSEVVTSAVKCVAFNPELVKLGKEALGLAMEALVWFMRNRGSMKKRMYAREDIYSIFVDPRSTAVADKEGEMDVWGNVALTVFRSSSPYFLTPWIGVTLIVYEGEGEDMRIWIQKSAAQTYCGGMLDTTAGGAVETGHTAWEGIAKEAEEEANLPEKMIRKYASFHGGLNFYLDPQTQPKPLVHLCFDMKRPDPGHAYHASTQPQICDDEVDAFISMSPAEVMQALLERKFQPSAVPDLISFLSRKGVITMTRDSEPEIETILARFEKSHEVALPHRLLEVPARWT